MWRGKFNQIGFFAVLLAALLFFGAQARNLYQLDDKIGHCECLDEGGTQ